VTRKVGHSALRVKDGKIEKFDPYPDSLAFPVVRAVEFSTREDARKAKALCEDIQAFWRDEMAANERDWNVLAGELHCENTREEIVKTIRNLYKQNLAWADALAAAKDEVELLKRKADHCRAHHMEAGD
jgi:hypothetical protein